VISTYLVLLDPGYRFCRASIPWVIRRPFPETTPLVNHLEVIYRAGPPVGFGQIDVGDIAIVPGHFKARMAQKPLQAEGVAAVSQERNSRRVAHRMRRTAYPLQSGFLAEAAHDGPEIVLVQRLAVHGQENGVNKTAIRLRAAQRQITPQQFLNLTAEGHLPFLAAFAPDFQYAIFQLYIAHLQAAQLADPQAGIEQRQENGVVSKASLRLRFGGGQQRRQLCLGEGSDDLFRRFRDFNPVEGVGWYQVFRQAPVGETFQAAEVAVQGMAGQFSVGFGLVQRVGGEPPLLPEVQDESADGVGVQIGGVVRLAFGVEKTQEVDDRRGRRLDRPGAFTLGGVAQLETFQQAVDVLRSGATPS